MPSESWAKLTKASEVACKSLAQKWHDGKSRYFPSPEDAARAEAMRQKDIFLQAIEGKMTGHSGEEMAPLRCDLATDHRAVFLVTIPISFGWFELSERSYKLLAKHVGMSLDSVSHWAVCVIDRGLGDCYCYDLMSDRLELTALGKNYFRVNRITEDFIESWSSCYYVGETTKTHDEIQQIGLNHTQRKPRYSLLSNNCQHLVDSLVKDLCNGKVISQAKLDEELSLASPKIARDLMVAKLRSKLDSKGESEENKGVKEDVDAIKKLEDLWERVKHR